MPDLFDVIEVQMERPRTVRVIDRNKTEQNADAVVHLAVMRRGVDTSFFATCPAGRYGDGDLYGSPSPTEDIGE